MKERERKRWITSFLLLPHEEKDYTFYTKDMIVSFAFT
jgi:hypothetical protein